VALAAVHFARSERRAALRAIAGLLAGLVLVTAAGAGFAWRVARPGRPFAAWLSSYAGGAAPPRAGLAYGLRWMADGIALSAARALYGSGSALVDLAPAVAAVRDRGEPARAAGIGLAWLLGAAALGGGLAGALARRQPADRAALLLQAIWWPAVLGFGLYWNNSDDQFYFQLAVAFGALAARLPAWLPERGRAARLLLGCGAAALAWNAADLAARFLLYPRAEWTAALTRELEGACLVVVPGWDDASNLLALAGGPGGEERLPLAELAVAMPAGRGLPRLAAEARRCLAAGRRVDLVEVYDSPPQAPPWRFLRQLGYERGAVERALDGTGGMVDRAPRRAGPFRVRSLRPPAPVRP
jgi:hypothetical protein